MLRVVNRKTIGANRLAAERIPLGAPEDYKPCVALLPDGELLVVAFNQARLGGGKIREDMVLFRSGDGGKTWSERQVVPLLGREPYFSVLKDGTLLVTVHLLKQDVRNQDGYVHSYVHRSTDGGKTWQTLRLGPEDLPSAPAGDWTLTSRNVLELRDGTLIMGVSATKGVDYLWRSNDQGQTWEKTRCEFEGVDKEELWWPFFAATVFWQARNDDLLALFRVDPKVFPPIPGTKAPQAKTDQVERMILYRSQDGGRKWTREPEIGSDYGEMYPALLRLQDGRLLMTFTVRDLAPRLGVHTVLGEATADGFSFDYDYDRVVLSERTPPGKPSGGGFGPTVQLKDGTLVTAYSYRGEDDKTRLEVLRWRLPAPHEKLRSQNQRPTATADLERWLRNMVWHHRFSVKEVQAATGMAPRDIRAALKRLDISAKTRPERESGAPLLMLPYPGGRHPRIGFLEGALDPQRETKISVFTPWDPKSYVVVDVPEAIWSNLGLTYLAHTHVPTIWTKPAIELEPLEWTRHADGSLEFERVLPNGIVFGATAEATPTEVRMEMWLRNGTEAPLSNMRVQNCVMLKGARGFTAQTNENKLFRGVYAAVRSKKGNRWVITAWDHPHRTWGNAGCPCLHSDPRFPDAKPGETVRLKGWLSFYQGDDIDGELARIEALGWRGDQ